MDTWLALIAEQDRPLIVALLETGLALGSIERLSVRVSASAPEKLRLLELSLIGAPTAPLLIAASRDVTAEHSREDLRRQKAAAERANRAKSEFMSQVSHELRTPLNAILGFAQLMAMDGHSPLPQVHLERLRLIQHSGQRLLKLIDQLLHIGRAEHGKRHLKVRDLPVLDVVKRCMDSLQLLAQERGVTVWLDVQDDGLTVRADEQAFEQILTNLLSNAIKYNKEQGRVRVRIRCADDVEITVDDTGAGLSAAQVARLFEPFNRLSADGSGIQGTGLGLFITKQLIEALGGRLEVCSGVGTGSRFEVHLPPGNRERTVRHETSPLNIPSRWATGIRSTVLYIEDDEVNVLLMQQLFGTQPDWELVVAATATEGIAMARRQPPDLVLVDMNLPDADGLQVLRALRADTRTGHIRCIAVSADAVPRHIAHAAHLGFEDYWTKPLDLIQTVARIKKLLR